MSITLQDFFKPLTTNITYSVKDSEKIKSFIECAKSISQLTYQSVYIVDYNKRSFIYVSDNPIFLCGESPERVLKSGYLFYLRNVPDEDLELLLKINGAGFGFFNRLAISERLNYSISYDFHLKQEGEGLMLINHKLKPLLLDDHGNPWIALCLVSMSANSKSGNIRFKSLQLKKNYEFDIDLNEWIEVVNVKLKRREKEILLYSAQGLTMEQIATRLYLSLDTIKFHRKNLFTKLDVNNISEAISTSIDLSLI